MLLGHGDVWTTAVYIRGDAAHAASDPRAVLGGRAVGDGRGCTERGAEAIKERAGVQRRPG